MGGKITAISSGDPRKRQRLENRPPPRESQNNENGLSSLAHEINNPLEALHQLHYLIEQEGSLREKGRQYLAMARDEVKRISQVLHAAMELRDSGDPEDTDVPELLNSVINFYASRFSFRGIVVKTRYSSGLHLAGLSATVAANVRQPAAEFRRRHAEWRKDLRQNRPWPRMERRFQARSASHVRRYGKRHCRKKPGPHLGPFLHHKRSRGQRHRTFTGQEHSAETPWRATRPQQHPDGP